MRALSLLAILTTAAALAAAAPIATIRPVSTYSIVARDADTGDMGVAVPSHWFSVGSIVTWADAGVGAVVAYLRLIVDVLIRRSWRQTVGRARTRARHRRRLGAVAAAAFVGAWPCSVCRTYAARALRSAALPKNGGM